MSREEIVAAAWERIMQTQIQIIREEARSIREALSAESQENRVDTHPNMH